MRKKPHGRHVDTGEIDALAIRELREPVTPPAGVEIDDGAVIMFSVHGYPGQEPQVTEHPTPVEQTHANTQLTGSIISVSLDVFGDGTTQLTVYGYHADEARAQWDIAAATIGSFRINPFPVPAEGQTICVYCGGVLSVLSEDRADVPAGTWVHANESPYCANATGSVAYPVRLVARGSRPNQPASPTDLPPELNHG